MPTDPTLETFLDLLTKHMALEPEAIRPIPVSLLQHAISVTDGITIDHDARIDDTIVSP
jgi:hypothetical protein